MRVRVGAVGFLNAVPLIEGLDRDPEIELSTDTPARLAQRLAAGELDLGLVPVVEAARLQLAAVPGIGITSAGPVRSVLLLSRRPLAEVRTLALDPASRTSAALARLLLARVHDVRPALLPGPAAGPPLPDGADAALVIGDRALAAPAPGLEVTDLAQWWRKTAGFPFVFAVWAGRDPALVASLAPRLARARDQGVSKLDALADREGPPRGVPPPAARAYLRGAIGYAVGARERDGLALFLEQLRKESLLEEGAAIAFAAADPPRP